MRAGHSEWRSVDSHSRTHSGPPREFGSLVNFCRLRVDSEPSEELVRLSTPHDVHAYLIGRESRLGQADEYALQREAGHPLPTLITPAAFEQVAAMTCCHRSLARGGGVKPRDA